MVPSTNLEYLCNIMASKLGLRKKASRGAVSSIKRTLEGNENERLGERRTGGLRESDIEGVAYSRKRKPACERFVFSTRDQQRPSTRSTLDIFSRCQYPDFRNPLGNLGNTCTVLERLALLGCSGSHTKMGLLRP